MNKKRQFSTKDIGAELLPIITRGLYRDPLDTLREYIQNGIDAQASNIEVIITSDVITIRDDGRGMARPVADKAIRLGISDKNPKQDVGFRGIGIYSAFNVCAKLEIYTRPATGEASRIVFDFDSIRNTLKNEETKRLKGKASSLYLEKLLESSVWVEPCSDCPLAAQGTMVMMIGIKGPVARKLTTRTDLKKYLESVVPLPFHPEFQHKTAIEDMFRKADYRVINLSLTLDGKKEQLYRPYYNGMFTNGGGFGPKHYYLHNLLTKGRLGFAWVCLNDARKVLPIRDLRGLLVKKIGFSVGGRDLCLQFFGRSVCNNRVTGEVIVTQKDLLPNAARTEFEPSAIRDSLYLALTDLATTISSWVEEKQSELKAREELEIISPDVFRMVKEIPESERDVPQLLRINNTLASYASRLRIHDKTLKDIDPDLLTRTALALKQAQDHIAQILSEKSKRGQGRRRRIEEALKSQAKAPTKEELVHGAEKPTNLLEVISASDIETSSIIREILRFLDHDIRQRVHPDEYDEMIETLSDFIEEST